jgi:cytosine/adenosine deaminase-related metal-dependent hydrolase
MTAGPLRDGGVVFAAGRVEAVGSARDLRRTYPDAVVEDMGPSIILPGLVNPHTHLELSHIRRGEPPPNLAHWIETTLMPQGARFGEASPDLVRDAVRAGVEQCLRFGVTSVGDISKQSMHTRPALRNGPLRAVSYGEIQAMAKRRGLLEERFAVAADTSCESDRLHIGITPHAPYTVEPPGYARCLAFAKMHQRPLATHLAETAEEATFLASHAGPFRHLWEAGVNAWDDDVPRFNGGPIRFARDLGLLDYPTLLAHVNYCDDDELTILAGGKASVVYCPRTHQFFGHPPHRWRDMLTRGINVAIGTDSCASSPDLNLVDDLRVLHRLAPEMAPFHLWEMATTRAARALGVADAGVLRPGCFADLVVFPCATDDPLREILQRENMPAAVWIDGKRVAQKNLVL